MLQLVSANRGSLQALGEALPRTLANLDSDMTQLIADMAALTRVHSSCSEIAALYGQVHSLLLGTVFENVATYHVIKVGAVVLLSKLN